MESVIIPLIALFATSVGAIIGATAYLVSRLSNQDTMLKDVRDDLAELKAEQTVHRKLGERVAILEFRMSKSGEQLATKPHT